MKKILIVHSNMELGGAETSLLGLLQNIDYTKYTVDLLLMEKKGELLSLIPEEVNLLQTPNEYKGLVLPIKDVIFRQHLPGIAYGRLLGKVRGRSHKYKTYATKQYAHYYSMKFLPRIDKKYDMAISFIDPHFIVAQKVNARITLGWLHTDFSRVKPDTEFDHDMWNGLDYIVHISDSCKDKFDKCYPDLAYKSIVIENLLSKAFVCLRSAASDVVSEMPKEKYFRLLSIGRYSHPKNFDSIPDICAKLINSGLSIKWYIIGYGSEEALIKEKIVESNMEDNVILLGKKTNPYPYIKECDLYVQPSRYEGKCVAVREAQMLGKPVVITKYATSASQLEDGVDGVIVPMDNQGCAEGIAAVLNNKSLMEQLHINCTMRDYSNREEVEKLYKLINDED